MTLVVAAPRENRLMRRFAVALVALGLAALVVFGLGALIAGGVPGRAEEPVRRRHPRGSPRRLRHRGLGSSPSRRGSTGNWRPR